MLGVFAESRSRIEREFTRPGGFRSAPFGLYHEACTCPSSLRSCPCSPSASDELPEGDQWIFEPKWDGFRALIFRDGDEILIQSRDEKPLNRYFPELMKPLADQLPATLRARWRDCDRKRRWP